ncbi:LptF/LptG family permease [Candidatus Pelagibacter bacterium nBUS_44]|uniref:LptF/LptG family permease n=1 Tax=Candidatus Pelagibacter bacterium nBUS_44 TaxID=3374195 RepID=UPI003EBFABB1
MLSLVFILNVLSELEFFKDIDVGIDFTLLLSLLNSPSMIFEMFPFIFLLTTQFFFIKLFNNNELEVFKYSGLKNSSILIIISFLSLIMGIIIITVYYNFSANLKNFYLEKKSQYTTDGKYLAVVTKNGLWIKDEIDDKIYVINSTEIRDNFLIDNFITEFNKNYEVIRNVQSKKIDISKKQWIISNAKIYNDNDYEIKEVLKINTNFNYKRITTLYSNLSSLNFFQIIELKNNYKKLNYSLTEVNMQILKIIAFPLYLVLITILSALIMFKIKRLDTTTFKISLGLFISVIIYYINNFFLVMGNTERIPLIFAIFTPLVILGLFNTFMIYKINEK